MSLAIYTFRSFPKISALKKEFPHLFIFGKLKQDIESFCDHLLKVKPNFVIGVAATKTKSVFEPTAINNIHGHKVIATAPEKLSLHTPNLPIFPRQQDLLTHFAITPCSRFNISSIGIICHPN